MTRRVRIEPEAEAELQGAAEWYEEQEPGIGLGFALLAAAESGYRQLEEGHHGTPFLGLKSAARRIPIPGFPLWVVFVELVPEVVIVAYAHERRKPGYWLERLRSS